MQLPEPVLSLSKQIKSFPAFKPLTSRQRQFILAFSKTYSVSVASEVSGIPWINHYKWLKKHDDYKQAFDFAKEIAGDYAEGDVYQRAFIGEDREVTKLRGDQVITEKYKNKSDVLAIFMLKGLRPQYRDNFSINNFSGPIQLNVKHSTTIIDPLEQTSLPTEENKSE